MDVLLLGNPFMLLGNKELVDDFFTLLNKRRSPKLSPACIPYCH